MRTQKKVINKVDFYYVLFELISITKDFSITSNDIKVLSYLYDKHDSLLNSGINISDIGNFIFATEVRKKLSDKIGISVQSYNNSVSKLRKQGFINKNTLFYFGESVHSYFYTKKTFSFSVDFIL